MKPRIIFLGAVPPPYMGPTLATVVILNSRLREEFDLIHLNTSDHRGLDKLGVIDLRNILLAFKSYFSLISLIITKKPDLVYIPISYATLACTKDSIFIIISKLFGRKVICHLRGGSWLNSAGLLATWYIKGVHRLVDGQIVLGESLKHLFAGILPTQKVFVVPNGKDIPYTNKNRKDGNIRVLFIANIRRAKGVMDVLHAAPTVCAKCPNVEFLFAGAWNEVDVKDEVKAYLHQHRNLPIKWLGALRGKEKEEIIKSADIFVFPTYYPAEGHPWVIVEAMAAGLPIISTAHGAITESVKDGVNGFIVEKQNPALIAEKVIALITSEELRKAMGCASKRMYEEKFTEEKMIRRMSLVFNELVAR